MPIRVAVAGRRIMQQAQVTHLPGKATMVRTMAVAVHHLSGGPPAPVADTQRVITPIEAGLPTGVLPTMGITASHIMNSIIMMSSRIMDTIMGTILMMSSLIMGTILMMGITASRIMDTIMMSSHIMDTITDTVLMRRSRGLRASRSKVRLRPLLCMLFPRWSCQCQCPWGRLRLWRHLRWLCPRRRRW